MTSAWSNWSDHVGTRFKSTCLLGCLSCIHHCTSTWHLSLIRNGSSCCDLLLNSQNFFRSILAGVENPSLSRLCYQRLWESRNRRALILGWVYYLDAFNNYPLRTWLPSVYRGHDNWNTRGASFSVLSY